MSDPDRRKELLDVYKAHLDEYHFVVRLNWDRTRYFLVLNIAIIAAATGLLKLTNVSPLISALFGIGVATSAVSLWAIRESRLHYRVAVFKKTLLEEQLGFTQVLPGCEGKPAGEYCTLAIGSTRGQAAASKILANPTAYLRKGIRPGSVVFWLCSLMVLTAVFNLYGLYVTWAAGTSPVPPQVDSARSSFTVSPLGQLSLDVKSGDKTTSVVVVDPDGTIRVSVLGEE